MIISGNNQMAAYRANLLQLNELSDSVKEPILAEFVAERIGFIPEAYCQVAGVTFEGRQAKIAHAALLCSFTDVPPVELVPEPENAYDEYAVKVMVGTLNTIHEEWYMEHVGYLPRGVCLACGANLTGAMAKKPKCNFCGSSNIDLEFNKWIAQELAAERKVTVGIDWISNQQDKRDSFIGIRLALAGGRNV